MRVGTINIAFMKASVKDHVWVLFKGNTGNINRDGAILIGA